MLLTLVFLIAIFKEVIEVYFFFDIGAEDLSGMDAMAIKGNILASTLSLKNFKFRYMSFVSFYIPVLLIIVGNDYNKIKSNLVKFNIGKNNLYARKMLTLKFKLSFISGLLVSFIFVFIVLSAFFLGSDHELYDAFIFQENSLLANVISNDGGYIAFILLTLFISTFINGMFLFLLIDYSGYVYGSMSFLGLLWIGSILLYRVLPYYFVPMTTIMATSYDLISLDKLICSYSILCVLSVGVKLFNTYEVQ